MPTPFSTIAKTEPAAQAEVRRVPQWKRDLASASRWLHTYLSMASFAIVFFFAATGITLNHPDWFGPQAKPAQSKGSMPREWAKAEPPAKLEIVERLRAAHRVSGALSDFRVDPAQLSVSFKGPGYTADAFIDRETGAYELAETRMGFVAVINDLHKGRDSGKAWPLLIDGAAAMMCFVSITGMLLIFFLKKRLVAGLFWAAVGAAACYGIYAALVP